MDERELSHELDKVMNRLSLLSGIAKLMERPKNQAQYEINRAWHALAAARDWLKEPKRKDAP
jgi:hypothetical protein